MEGVGARMREVCSMEGWVQCSRIEEEGLGEESGVEGYRGCR
jgi:hypothetical protein